MNLFALLLSVVHLNNNTVVLRIFLWDYCNVVIDTYVYFFSKLCCIIHYYNFN